MGIDNGRSFVRRLGTTSVLAVLLTLAVPQRAFGVETWFSCMVDCLNGTLFNLINDADEGIDTCEGYVCKHLEMAAPGHSGDALTAALEFGGASDCKRLADLVEGSFTKRSAPTAERREARFTLELASDGNKQLFDSMYHTVELGGSNRSVLMKARVVAQANNEPEILFPKVEAAMRVIEHTCR
jgi:hypothetical protein